MASDQISTPFPTGRFLLLHDRDNVLICAERASSGTIVNIDGQKHVLTCDIEIGHKIARTKIARGQKVFRYGFKIGTLSADANPGDHIHSHNLQSDYITAHDRGATRNQEIRS